MIGPFERHKSAAQGLIAQNPALDHHLQRHFHSRASIVREEHSIQPLGRQSAQSFCEAHRWLVGSSGEEHMIETLVLFVDGLENGFFPMPMQNGPPGTDAIDKFAAVFQLKLCTLGSHYREGLAFNAMLGEGMPADSSIPLDQVTHEKRGSRISGKPELNAQALMLSLVNGSSNGSSTTGQAARSARVRRLDSWGVPTRIKALGCRLRVIRASKVKRVWFRVPRPDRATNTRASLRCAHQSEVKTSGVSGTCRPPAGSTTKTPLVCLRNCSSNQLLSCGTSIWTPTAAAASWGEAGRGSSIDGVQVKRSGTRRRISFVSLLNGSSLPVCTGLQYPHLPRVRSACRRPALATVLPTSVSVPTTHRARDALVRSWGIEFWVQSRFRRASTS